MSDNELRATVHQVVRAITVEGKHPPTHRRIMTQHRVEWPTLWQALDKLMAVAKMNRPLEGHNP